MAFKNCREEYGVHTCDKRRTKAEIAADFPNVIFEEGFVEGDDPLYKQDERETKAHVAQRAKAALDYIFVNDTEEGKHYTLLSY